MHGYKMCNDTLAGKCFLVTCSAGFIASAVILYLIDHAQLRIDNVDKLTYAENLECLAEAGDGKPYHVLQAYIWYAKAIEGLFNEYTSDVATHQAAESHVDRPISDQTGFIQTNTTGTYMMLDVTRQLGANLGGAEQTDFRFSPISSYEVNSSLVDTRLFTKQIAYDPSPLYSASKASFDHPMRTWNSAFSVPVLVTICPNNYRLCQLPEKFIPLVILSALKSKPSSINDNAIQVRDWPQIEDRAQSEVVTEGKTEKIYTIGGHNQKTFLETAKGKCAILDRLRTNQNNNISRYEGHNTYVRDRLGHDQLYAKYANKVQRELDWAPQSTSTTGILKSVIWRKENTEWIDKLSSGDNRNWMEANYGKREAI